MGLDMLHFDANRTKLPKNPVHASSLNLSTLLFDSNNQFPWWSSHAKHWRFNFLL